MTRRPHAQNMPSFALILVLLFLCGVSAVDNADLSFYDDVRFRDTSVALSSDVVEFKDTDAQGKENTYHLRHLAAYVALVVYGDAQDHLFVGAAASLMAIHHFNNGIDDVVPEIKGAVEDGGCDIKFTLEFFDTEFSPITAARDLSQRIFPRQGSSSPDPTAPFPTSLIGAVRSAVSSPLAGLSGVKGLPQISYASTSTVFDNKDQYPLFGRMIPSAIGDAYAAVDYLSVTLSVTHLGVLFVRDPYGSTYAQAIKEAAGRVKPPMEVTLASFSFDANAAGISDAIRQLKDSGFKYFFGIIFAESHHEQVMSEAYRQKIAGPGYFWMYGDGLSGAANLKYPNTSGAIAGTSGSAVILLADPSTRLQRQQTAAFMQHWHKFVESEEWLGYFLSKLPESVTSAQGGAILEGVDLSRAPPSAFSLLQYDAVISLALASCKASLDRNSTFFTGADLFDSFKRTEFEGAYSHVAIDGATGSRDYTTMPYALSNIVAGEEDSNGDVSFSVTVTHIYDRHHHVTGFEWQEMNGSEFVYSDGTTVAPLVLPPLDKETNPLGAGARAFGLLLCAISLTLSAAFGVWTIVQRDTIVVKASQPFFLYLLCVGTFIMGSAMIPMSIEDCDAACQSIPWLFTTGFNIAFSALLSKMKRVNEIYFRREHRRVTVRVRDVIKPFACLLVANLCVLISWTVVSPLESHDVETGSVDRFGRSTESYTTCFPDDPAWQDLTFLLLLTGINLCALLYANYEAFKGRCIRTAYSESEYIGLTMLILLQAFVIGVPIMFVVYDSPTARFVVLCCLATVTCYAILLPIFLPKRIYLREHREREERVELKKRLVKKKRWMMDGLAYGDWASEVSSHPDSEVDEDEKSNEGLEIIDGQRYSY